MATGLPTIGVISDTHGLVRPEALAALRGVDRILHAGDIGGPEVLHALEAVEVAGAWLYVLHDVKELDLDPRVAGFAAVVSGHSHRPAQEERDGVLYFNPGSAGPRRFRLPVSVGRLTVDAGRVTGTLLDLGGAP